MVTHGRFVVVINLGSPALHGKARISTAPCFASQLQGMCCVTYLFLECYGQFLFNSLVSGLLFVVCRPRVLIGLHVDALSVGAVVGKWSLSVGEFVFSDDSFDVPIDGVVVALHVVHGDRHALLVRFCFADVEHTSSQDP